MISHTELGMASIDGTVSALAARYDRVYRIVGYRRAL
jgi:hypothetical protein